MERRALSWCLNQRATETVGVLGSITLVIAVLYSLSGRLLAQDSPTPTYHSPFVGEPVPHPELLSGFWEAPDGQGGAVGVHLQLTTTVPAVVLTLRGVTQSWFGLQGSVYQRKGDRVQRGEESFFADSYPDSNIRFDRGRLTLHFTSSRTGVPAVDLDLLQQPGSAWEGRIHRGGFDARVKLLRPGEGKRRSVDPLVGTWLQITGNLPPERYCLHVAEQTETGLTGWEDLLAVPGSVQDSLHLPRPATAQERYGEPIEIRRKQVGSFSFELGGYSGVCCPHTFIAKLNRAGTLLKETSPPGLNPAPHPGSWRKMRGNSCVDPGQ